MSDTPAPPAPPGGPIDAPPAEVPAGPGVVGRRAALRLLGRGALLGGAAVGGAEAALRTVLAAPAAGIEANEDFYEPARVACAAGPVDVFTVGSSRVAAAVSAEVLSGRLGAGRGTPASVVNLGKGFSSAALHHLGLAELYRSFPAAAGPATVLVEAPGGVGLHLRWDGPWVHEEWPTLAGPLLSAGTVGRFLRLSDNTAAAKAAAVAAWPSKTARLIRGLRLGLEARVNARSARLLPPTDRAAKAPAADLAAAGGVRADVAGVAATRAGVLARGPANGGAVEVWPGSATEDLVRLVKRAGGTPAFFEMPEGPVVDGLTPPGLQAARVRAFRAWAAAEGVPVVPVPDFPVAAADYPDHLHLRASRRDEFSAELAAAVLAAGVVS